MISRRGWLGGMAAAVVPSDDGLRRPLNAPQGQSSSPGVQPGVSQAVVTANRIIVFGQNGGVFVYLGTPALGNPPADWISENTVDPFGNPLPHVGVGSQSTLTGQWAAISAGELLLAFGSAGAAAVNLTGPGTLTVNSPANGTNQSILQMISGAVPTAVLNSALTATAGTAAVPTLVTTDTPQTLALLNGWSSAVAPAPPPKLWLTNEGELAIAGELRQAVAPTNAIFAVVPGGYTLPTHNGFFAAGVANNAVTAGLAPFIQCDTAGNLSVQGVTIASNPIVVFGGHIKISA